MWRNHSLSPATCFRNLFSNNLYEYESPQIQPQTLSVPVNVIASRRHRESSTRTTHTDDQYRLLF
jgi:hypothetical protein